MTVPQSLHGWHKSSYSSQTNNCVEARHSQAGGAVRDTKNRAAGLVEFTPAQWATFLGAVKRQ